MMFHILRTDLSAALRTLWRSWSFTLLVIGLLAAGLSVNVAAFSVLKELLHGPISLVAPDRIVAPAQHNPHLGDTQHTLSPAAFLALKAAAPSIRQIAAYQQLTLTDSTVGNPIRVAVASVSPNFFEVLAVRPLLGRGWSSIDTAAPLDPTVVSHSPAAVISHEFWRERLGGRLDVLNSRLTLDEGSYVVIGVMPAGFHLPGITDVWVPLSLSPRSPADWGTFSLRAVARLDPDVTVRSAQLEATLVARQFQAEVPINRDMDFRLVTLRESLAGEASQAMMAVFAITLVMFLVLCTTFINLVVHRAIERQDEFSIHLALGATQWSVARRYLLEVTICAWLAAAIAVGAGYWIARVCVSLASLELLVASLRFDYSVAAYTFILVTLASSIVALVSTALVFSVARSQLAPQARVRTVSRGQRYWNTTFLAVQILMAVIFVHGASTLVRSYERLRTLDLRFDPADVVVLDATLPSHRYGDPYARALFVENALDSLMAVPGVEAVGASVRLPVMSDAGGIWFDTEQTGSSAARSRTEATFNPITRNYFAVMRIPLRAGRVIGSGDTAQSTPVAVVNKAFAVRFLSGRDPVGQKLSLTPWPNVSRTVVGVVEDVPHGGLRTRGEPTIYVPYAQVPIPALHFVVRSHANPERLVKALQARIRALDSHLALGRTDTMRDRLAVLLRPFQLATWLVSVFGVLALVFAAAGAYGLTARQVSQERRSIGIRLALGASPRSVVGLLMAARGQSIAGGGIVGLIGALAVTQFVNQYWSEVEATFGLNSVVALLVLSGAVSLATYIGARSAGAVDPANLLRGE